MFTKRDNEFLRLHDNNIFDMPIVSLAYFVSHNFFEHVLKQGYDSNKYDDKHGYLIHQLFTDHVKMKIAIKYGADVNKKTDNTEYSDSTLLLLVKEIAYHSEYMKILRVLLKNGVDVYHKNNMGEDVFIYIKKCAESEEYNDCYCHQSDIYDPSECSNCTVLRRHKKVLLVLENHVKRKKSFFELMLPLLTNKKQRVY